MENLPDQTKQNSFIRYGKGLASKFLGKGKRKNRRVLAATLGTYFALQLGGIPKFLPELNAWYSVKTNHGAVVTNTWNGKREIKYTGNHFKKSWKFLIPNVFTKVDEHLLTEHMWYFRMTSKKKEVKLTNYNQNKEKEKDIPMENYTDIMSADKKQTSVRVVIKYKINKLEKFALPRMDEKIEGVKEHDLPYVSTGLDLDDSISLILKSIKQDNLIKGIDSNGNKIKDEILKEIVNSEMEQKNGMEISSVAYDAVLVPQVARANAEKQRNILLGEGFLGRSKNVAQGWHQILYGGFLNIKPGSENDKKSLVDLTKNLQRGYRETLLNKLDSFAQGNVIKDREGDVMWVPYGQPFVPQTNYTKKTSPQKK